MLKRKGSAGTSGGWGHIRPNTAGTSNEISFSVLDAKLPAADAPTHPAWEFSSEEVKTRKRTRKRHRRLKTVAIIAGIGVILAAIVLFVASGFHVNMDNVDHLHAEAAQVQSACDSLDEFEELTSTALNSSLADIELESFTQKLPEQKKIAEDVSAQFLVTKQEIEQLQPNLKAADLEASNQAISAINSEQNMIQIGQSALDRADTALHAYSSAQEAMQLLLSADSLARESAALIETGTSQGAQQSIAKSNECVAEFTRAREALVAAQAYQEASSGLEPFLQYVDLRIQAQSFAIASTQSYIDRKRDEMIQANDHYNTLESQAAALIAKSELHPSDVVAAAYAQAVTADADQWSAESARCAVAYTAVKEYAH